MKKNFLMLTTLTTISLPIATAISCGNDEEKEDMSKIVNISINENSWKPIYDTIIKDFKENNKELLKEKGIKDIRVLVGNPGLQEINNKGIRDEEAVSDIFHIPGNELSKFIEKKALTSFSQNLSSSYLSEHFPTSENRPTILSSAQDAIHDSKLYGVPQNVEAMVTFHTHQNGKQGGQTSSPQKLVVTQFANLWMSAGFFNTSDSKTSSGPTQREDTAANLKDIVVTNPDAGDVEFGEIKTSSSETKKGEWTKFVKLGFQKIVKKIQEANKLAGAGNQMSPDSFLGDGQKASPKVNEFWSTNKDKISLIEGPWSSNSLQEMSGSGTSNKLFASPAPSDWNQWGGGWHYVMNARMTSQEKSIAEKFISYFYDKKYAKELYEKTGKLSPTVQAKTYFKAAGDGSDNASGYKDKSSIPAAVYDSLGNVYKKPTDAAFNGIWAAYGSTVETKKNELNQIISAGVSDANIDLISDALTNEFIKQIEAYIAKENS